MISQNLIILQLTYLTKKSIFMKKTNLAYALLSFGMLFTLSCSKDSSTATNGSGGAGNTCTSNYAPYRVGSSIETVDQSGTKSITNFVKDTTMNGMTYFETKTPGATASSVRSWIGRDNSGNVRIKTSGGDPIGGGRISVETDYVLLYPAKAIGDTWSSRSSVSLGSGFSMDYHFNFKILEKNITAVVDGKTYSNGIKLLMESKITMMGVPSSSSTLEYTLLCGLGSYMAKQNGQAISTTTKYTY